MVEAGERGEAAQRAGDLRKAILKKLNVDEAAASAFEATFRNYIGLVRDQRTRFYAIAAQISAYAENCRSDADDARRQGDAEKMRRTIAEITRRRYHTVEAQAFYTQLDKAMAVLERGAKLLNDPRVNKISHGKEDASAALETIKEIRMFRGEVEKAQKRLNDILGLAR